MAFQDTITKETPKIFDGMSPNIGFGANNLSSAILNISPKSASEIYDIMRINPFDITFKEENQKVNRSPEELNKQGLIPNPGTNITYSPSITFLKTSKNNTTTLSPGVNNVLQFLKGTCSENNFLKNDSPDILQLAAKIKESQDRQFLIESTTGNDSATLIPKTADVIESFLEYEFKRNNQAAMLHKLSNNNSGIINATQNISSAKNLTNFTLNTFNNNPGPSNSTDNSLTFSLSNKSSENITLNNSNSFSQSYNPTFGIIDSSTGQNDTNEQLLNLSTSKVSQPDNFIKNTNSQSYISLPVKKENIDGSVHNTCQWNQQGGIQSIQKPSIQTLCPASEASSFNNSMGSSTNSNIDYYPSSVNSEKSEKSTASTSSNSINSSSKKQSISGTTNNSQNPPSNAPRGRGRRSTTSDLPPDERRNTILERNKAAAVRYRKRKKEEHDEMLSKVTNIEKEKNKLMTQNALLVQENEKLKALLNAKNAQCVCQAKTLLPVMNNHQQIDHIMNNYINLGGQ
ncbi:Basic-leucine zipper domain-containing protein [Strongyloides ratti]|uniref:Basic-leucine zipper domain-containing protein n=1 Tax=Strongyloides ratti TaxID=34506 RepID=A0A090MYG2_STRRB|nr:Basic-leucine zipper domain-containing protein [Strongyloides ratti]CEF67129.1 Basic-leucine zipper domain-containing protein [Strongyloides ratti]